MPYTAKQRALFHAKAKDKSLPPKKRAEFERLAEEADSTPTKPAKRKKKR